MFSQFVNRLFDYLSKLSLDFMLYITWGAYLAVFLLALFLAVKSKRVRSSAKGPFLCLTNAFAAITLCIFLTANGLGQSILGTALFWCVGYVLYGILCFCTKERQESFRAEDTVVSVSAPPAYPAPPKDIKKELPPLNSSVRLEYALSVTESLLKKNNVGRGDRQELEKLKLTLETLKLKGELSAAEGEILNDNFNALLKLMAKYDI